MPEIEAVRKIAQRVLTAPPPSGSTDNWLWDRTLRILRNLEHICRLPELANQAVSVDHFCLVTATYFAESGFIGTPGQRNMTQPDMNHAELYHLSTLTVSNELAGVLSDTRIDKINKIITQSASRFTKMTEAMILSDSRNLEDMGAIGLLNEFRRHINQGKGVSDVLESWKCKIAYGYWEARLKESFKFDAVRRIAHRRFEVTESFMDQLAEQNSASDLEEQLLQTLEKA